MSYLLEKGKGIIGNHHNDGLMIKFWEETGLLEGLDVKYHLMISKQFDELGKYLLETDVLMSVDGYEGFDVISFPAIRRIYTSAIKDDMTIILSQLDVRDILRILMKTYLDTIELVKNIYGDTNKIDITATSVAILSENIYFTYKYRLS